MPWSNDPAARRRSSTTYDAAWRKARQLALRAANGRCQKCGHQHTRLEVDHINGAANDPLHQRLQVLCKGPGTCRCHDLKTAAEGGGYRQPKIDPQPKPSTSW